MPLSRDDRVPGRKPPLPDGGSYRARGARLRLSELMSSDLCHDLAGPLGIIENSLELVAEDAGAAPAALTLASDAASMLVRRLKLIRAAWGGGPGELDVAGLRALAAGLPGHDIRLDLSSLAPDATIAAAPARLVLNLLLLAAEALSGQGIIGLAGDPAVEILLTIAGPRANWPRGLAAMLADEATAWDSVAAESADGGRASQAALTALIAHESGLPVSMLIATPGPPNAPLLVRCLPEV